MFSVRLLVVRNLTFRLAFEPTLTITDIAFEASFVSLEAFSRTFTRRFTLPRLHRSLDARRT